MGRHELDWSGSGQEQVVSCCEHGIKPPASIMCGECLIWLWNSQISKEDCSMEWVSEWVSQYMNIVFTSLLCAHKAVSLTGFQHAVSLMCWRRFPHAPPIWITSNCTCIGNAAQFQGWLYCPTDQGSLPQFANGIHHSLQWSGHCGWWTWISACRVDTPPLPARPIHKISRHFSR